MRNSKKAFTLLELVFVIVIIGMLASIAIPKLQASRNDSRVALELQSIAVRLQTILMKYTATSTFRLSDTDYITNTCYDFTASYEDDGAIFVNVLRNDSVELVCEETSKRAEKNHLIGEHILRVNNNVMQYE
jgi:prepilin-type N-terminal cleavage/methylation domain-containing protein